MSEYILEKTPLWVDIRDVIHSGKKPIRFTFKGMLHTEKEDIPILKIVSIDTIRDYTNNVGDHIQIEFKMSLGEYATRLYPYRTNLEFTIKQITLEENEAVKTKDSDILTERYKAIFLAKVNHVFAGTDLDNKSTDSLNRLTVLDVKLQLLPRSLEPIRVKTVSGVFKQVTQKKAIHSLLAGESSKILVDGKPAIDGLDLVDPNNLETKAHLIIPTGTLITSIPTFLQEKAGGVYNGGIGTYLQTYKKKKLWFVYPLFNTSRFDDKVDKAIFYAVPSDRFPSLDRTYRVDGAILHIVITSTKTYNDSADTDYMNHGSGFRMSDARSFMKKPVDITKDGPKAKRVNLNYEVAAVDRDDGINYAPTAASGSSNNPFKEYSKVLARSVARVDIVWENANFNLLYPGMPCKYIMLVKGKPVELKGIILFVHALSTLQGNGISNNTYRTMCQITIVVEKYTTKPDLPKSEAYGDF